MKNKPWIFFAIFCIIILQFFYVLANYNVIESEKVFWWIIKYFLPLFIVLSFFTNRFLAGILFYDLNRNHPSKASKSTRLKNWLTSFGLMLMMTNFFSYNTIILTNDWFGSDKYELVRTKILKVEHSQLGSYRRPGRGFEKWIISLKYKGKIIRLTTQKSWYEGEEFEMTLNTGGFFGVLYVG